MNGDLNETYFLDTLKKQVVKKLMGGSGRRMEVRDIQELCDATNIGAATIKRIFDLDSSYHYQGLPRRATLDLFVQYLQIPEVEDWKRWMIHLEGELTSSPTEGVSGVTSIQTHSTTLNRKSLIIENDANGALEVFQSIKEEYAESPLIYSDLWKEIRKAFPDSPEILQEGIRLALKKKFQLSADGLISEFKQKFVDVELPIFLKAIIAVKENQHSVFQENLEKLLATFKVFQDEYSTVIVGSNKIIVILKVWYKIGIQSFILNYTDPSLIIQQRKVYFPNSELQKDMYSFPAFRYDSKSLAGWKIENLKTAPSDRMSGYLIGEINLQKVPESETIRFNFLDHNLNLLEGEKISSSSLKKSFSVELSQFMEILFT